MFRETHYEHCSTRTGPKQFDMYDYHTEFLASVIPKARYLRPYVQMYYLRMHYLIPNDAQIQMDLSEVNRTVRGTSTPI